MIKNKLQGATVIDKSGVTVNPNIHLGANSGFVSGDILDANAVTEAINATATEINQKIDEIVGPAPEVLDTLAELADAINDDPDFFQTINDEIGNKEDSVEIIVPVNTEDETSPVGSITAQVNKYYRLDVPVETLTVTLPTIEDTTTVKSVVIYLTGGTTPAVTITTQDSKEVLYQDGYEIESGMTYEINCLYNGVAWVVGALTIDTGE